MEKELTDEEIERLDFLHDKVESFVNEILPSGRTLAEDDPDWPKTRNRILEAVWECIKDRGICSEQEFYPYRDTPSDDDGNSGN